MHGGVRLASPAAPSRIGRGPSDEQEAKARGTCMELRCVGSCMEVRTPAPGDLGMCSRPLLRRGLRFLRRSARSATSSWLW